MIERNELRFPSSWREGFPLIVFFLYTVVSKVLLFSIINTSRNAIFPFSS